MANEYETDYTSPNLRFGASFLNTKYRDRAVDDEVMMDKTTGSLTYKRPDGSYMTYDRENISITDLISQMKTLYSNNSTAIYPTKVNSNAYDNTYLLDVQFDFQSFEYQNPYTKRIEDGAVLVNGNNAPFNITHEMNGFFIQAIVRPRDISVVNLLSSVYDRYFKEYDGDDETYTAQKGIFTVHPEYEGKTVRVHYTITYYKDDTPIDEIQEDGYGKIQELSYIPFPSTEIRSRDDVDYITLTIDEVDLPKVKFAYDIKETEFTNEELELYTKIKDSQDIGLKFMDVIVYSTITDSTYYSPSKENSRILVAMNMSTIGDMFNQSVAGIIEEMEQTMEEMGETIKEEMPGDLTLDGTTLYLTVQGEKIGEGQKLPGGTLVGVTAPEEKTLTWIDTSVGGVLKYWNGNEWTPIKSTWG